ncbi:monocarboxylate transporter 10-like [Actinia tenebrosa]|uniref:Monocarboxylate transporter 10-like n=1 Tax=Actinia tenebrosa TaxID=6105 RepID=A0A6P8IPG5_ACTTE|nr:monocarboxylate transporter 10-like [Actinia tenebrosa]
MTCSTFPCLPGQNRPPHKQDGPWSWVVLLSSVIQNWLGPGFARSFGVFLPVLMKEFNEGRDKIALIGSVSSGTTFLMTVFTSWLCGHFGGQLICGLGFVIMIVSLILSSLIYNVNAMFFTFSLLLAFGLSFVVTSNILFTVKYFKKRRSLALGVNSAGVGVGVMTVPIIMQYLLDVLGWRNLYRVLSGTFVLFGFTALVFDPNVEEESHDGNEETADSPNQTRVKKVFSLRSMFDLSVWKVPKFTISVISIAIASFGVYNPVFHLVKFSEEIGISAAKASTLYTFLGLTSIISRVISGRLSDFSRIDPSLVNMSAEILGAVGLFVLPFAKTYGHMVAFTCVHGLVDGTFRTTTTVLLTSSVIQSKASSAFGQGYSMTAPFFVAGPAVAGLLADTSGTYKSAFFMSGVVLLVAAAIHIIPACIALRNRTREICLEPAFKETIPLPCVSTAYRERTESLKKNDFSQVNVAFDG